MILVTAAVCLVFTFSVSGEEISIPSAAKTKIDFASHVKPIFKKSCVRCHGDEKHKGGLSIATRETLLKGGESGGAVVVGKSAESLLIKLVSGLEPDLVMPKKGDRLTSEQIGLLRAWIDQGLSWEDGFSFGRKWRKAPLKPRRPKLPVAENGSGLTHPIDLLLQPYLKKIKFKIGKPVSEVVFARRVHLDIIGLLPKPEDLDEFINGENVNKRSLLVQKLLEDRKAYTEHWLTFWNDALRNAYRGTGYIDGGRKQITSWLYKALYDNMPYNQFVHELISPKNGSGGFIRGIKWRGVVNASQRMELQAAQNVSQVFLGTNVKCASCHDSFINYWKLADSYGLASVFADKPLELFRCDKPTGKISQVKFIYPELGEIDASAPKNVRMKQLADILTSPENGRLSRTIVNRLWAWFFGRGIVEPVDDMDQAPWSEDILDWLAIDLQDNEYNLKHTIEIICTSQAYQLESVGAPMPDEKNFNFRGPLVRRMTAEQFVDAVASLSGVWPNRPATKVVAQASTDVGVAFDPGMEKFNSGVMNDGAKAVDVDITGSKKLQLIVLDGGNGTSYDWADWAEPRLEGPAGTMKLIDVRWRKATTGYGKIQFNKNIVGKPMRVDGKPVAYGIGTHAKSVIVYELPPGYTRFKATVGPDTGSVEKKGTKVSVQFILLADDPRVGAELKESIQDGAKWIWSDPKAASSTAPATIYFRRNIKVDEIPSQAVAVMTCDNEFDLFLNGNNIISSRDWKNPVAVDFTQNLIEGTNTLAVIAINVSNAPNPAGFFFYSCAFKKGESHWMVGSDSSWLWSKTKTKGWEMPGFDTKGWQHSAELGGVDAGPWAIREKLMAALGKGFRSPSKSFDIGSQIRSALLNDNALTRALGRTNREQVLTRRDSIATTLQAIEMTNGVTLSNTLKKGAAKWKKEFGSAKPSELITNIYQSGLGRKPNEKEIVAAVELVNSQPTKESIEDLLWVLAMLPEFQLIY